MNFGCRDLDADGKYNNSTVATTWLDLLEFSNPSRSGIPARESQTGVWDPRRESVWVPGNQSQTRFLGSLGFGVWDLMQWFYAGLASRSGDDPRHMWDDDEMITRALESCRVPYRNNSYPLVMTDHAKYISVAPSRKFSCQIDGILGMNCTRRHRADGVTIRNGRLFIFCRLSSTQIFSTSK